MCGWSTVPGHPLKVQFSSCPTVWLWARHPPSWPWFPHLWICGPFAALILSFPTWLHFMRVSWDWQFLYPTKTGVGLGGFHRGWALRKMWLLLLSVTSSGYPTVWLFVLQPLDFGVRLPDIVPPVLSRGGSVFPLPSSSPPLHWYRGLFLLILTWLLIEPGVWGTSVPQLNLSRI